MLFQFLCSNDLCSTKENKETIFHLYFVTVALFQFVDRYNLRYHK